MTGISDWDDDRTEHLLFGALEVLDTAQDLFLQAISRLRNDAATTGRDVARELREYNGALQFALDMERKAREKRARDSGGVGHGALDLAAARAEVECRLACLRAACEGGDGAGGDE